MAYQEADKAAHKQTNKAAHVDVDADKAAHKQTNKAAHVDVDADKTTK